MIGDGPLAGKLTAIFGITIAADFGVSQMLAGEENTAGGGADGSAGVMVAEANAFLGQLVNVGGLDFGLTVGSEFAVSEVIGEDEDDIGFGLSGNCGGD